jgi:hypothetical protein
LFWSKAFHSNSLVANRGENGDADKVISNIRISIRVYIAIIKCGYYSISAYEVIAVLGLEIVIPASSKYKNELFIVEHYYSDHIC